MNVIDPQGPLAASSPLATSSEIEAAANGPHPFDAFRAALLARTRWPFVTPLLILANLVVFGLLIHEGMDWLTPDPQRLVKWGANYGPLTLAGEEWRLAACMFLHFGVVHLGMNMLALWNVGRFVERLYGNLGFLLLYVVSGLVGSFASVVFNPQVVSAGASGAIFGIAGGLLGGAWKIRKCLPPALLAAVRWLGFNVLGLLAIFSALNHFHQMIDNAAHVAGCLAGVLIGWILAEPIPNPKPSRRALRNLLVAVLGAAAAYGGLMHLPHPPTDVNALRTKYMRVEQDVVRILDAANGRLAARAITEKDYADILERDVLPRWSALREDFESAGPVLEDHRELVADLLKVIELREAGWTLKMEGFREGNREKKRQSQDKLDEAQEIIRRLNAKAKDTARHGRNQRELRLAIADC